MRIDLAAINREDFVVSDRGGRMLIVPQPTKFRWAGDELHLRSLLTTPDGEVLSSGFPKFFNYGEFETHTQEFRDAFSRGEVRLTHKEDGSLIIADRIDGEPHLRTRESHELGPFVFVREHIERNHPALFDFLRESDFAENHSLLFEYASLENRVVVKYDMPAFTLLGAVDKCTLQVVLDPDVLKSVSEEIGVPLVQEYDLPNNLDALLQEIWGWRGVEGVVARFQCNGEWRLIKLKSEWYLALHALLSHMSGKRLFKFCFTNNIFSLEDLELALASLGHDFEVIEYFREQFEDYVRRRNTLFSQFEDLKDVVAELAPIAAENRKDFVFRMREVVPERGWPKSFFNAAMSLVNGQDELAVNMIEALALDMTVPQLQTWIEERDEMGTNAALPERLMRPRQLV